MATINLIAGTDRSPAAEWTAPEGQEWGPTPGDPIEMAPDKFKGTLNGPNGAKVHWFWDVSEA